MGRSPISPLRHTLGYCMLGTPQEISVHTFLSKRIVFGTGAECTHKTVLCYCKSSVEKIKLLGLQLHEAYNRFGYIF